MILANKNGWMSIVKVLHETEKYIHVQNVDDPNKEGSKWKIAKSDTSRKLFDSAFDAWEWIESHQEN